MTQKIKSGRSCHAWAALAGAYEFEEERRRAISYSATAVATDTFKDATLPRIGISTM
jgi:hypothetical protein